MLLSYSVVVSSFPSGDSEQNILEMTEGGEVSFPRRRPSSRHAGLVPASSGFERPRAAVFEAAGFRVGARNDRRFLEHFVDLEPEAVVVVSAVAVREAVYFSGEVELRVPVVRLGVAQPYAPSGEVVYFVAARRQVFRGSYVYEGRELKAGDAERVAQFSGRGVAGVSVVVAVCVGAYSVDAAEEELFAAVEGAACELASGPYARVEFAPVPYLQYVGGEFMVSAVVVGSAVVGGDVSVPVDEAVLEELVCGVAAAAEPYVPDVGFFFCAEVEGAQGFVAEAVFVCDVSVVVAVDEG